MSEHEHEYQLEGGRRYYYCECGETGPGIVELWEERIESQVRIKALEGVLTIVGENIDDWGHTPPIKEAIDKHGMLYSRKDLMEMIEKALKPEEV